MLVAYGQIITSAFVMTGWCCCTLCCSCGLTSLCLLHAAAADSSQSVIHTHMHTHVHIHAYIHAHTHVATAS